MKRHRRDKPACLGQTVKMKTLAILTVRNEAAFILEWVAHHRTIGFTEILAFSNDCSDGTGQMLDRLAAMGLLTHVSNDGPHPEGPQWAALKRAEKHPLRKKADWIMVVDIDEFVNIHVGDHSLSALRAALPDATAIPLTWRFFGNGGHVRFENLPVTMAFDRAAPAVLYWPWRAALFKTLFRNDRSYGKLGVHRPRQPDADRMKSIRWFDGSGRELGHAFHTARIFSDFGQDNFRLAQLNHYALGSMESYIIKADRGRANRDAVAFDMSYWVERNFAQEADRSIAPVAAMAAPLRAELMADPALARLHGEAVQWRRDRFDKLMLLEPYRALFGRLLMAPPTRALPLTEAQFLLTYARRAAEPPPPDH